MIRHSLALALLLLGCSSSAVTPTCKPGADNSGTYWVEFATLSGTCPDQDSGLVRLDDGGDIPAGCFDIDAPVSSADGCTLELHRACDTPGIPGGQTEFTSVITQQDSAGDTFAGTLTMFIRDGSGELCHGSFRVSYVRQ